MTVHGIGSHDGSEDTSVAKPLGKFAEERYGSERTTNFIYRPESCSEIPSTGIHEVALQLLKEVQVKIESNTVSAHPRQR